MARTGATSGAPSVEDTEPAAHSGTDSTRAVPSPSPGAAGTGPAGALRPAGVDLPLPGSELLGRGIYLSPRQPYELKDYLLKRGTGTRALRIADDTLRGYSVPEDCEVNHSPPLPAGTFIGQTIIEESWSRFSQELTLNANAAVSASGLSIDATSFHGSNLKSEDESYYALRRSFIPFYSVYLPRVGEPREEEEDNRTGGLPASGSRTRLHALQLAVANIASGKSFDPAHRSEYTKIFDRYGTHYIKSAWIGGKATLIAVVTKSARLNKEDIRAGIEVTFAGTKTETGTSEAQNQERVRTNSSCTVFGSGGDATSLARLTSLQPEQYEQWVNSVKTNPEVIEFGVAGIWTLLKDPQEAEALKEAYLWESKFSPLNCIVPYQKWLVFTKGNDAFDYARRSERGSSRLYQLYKHITGRETIPQHLALTDYLPVLKGSDFEQPHAAFALAVLGKDLKWQWKLYLFNWRECLRMDLPEKGPVVVDEGYPRHLTEEWPDVDFDRIDAAVAIGRDKVFFFRGAKYIRLDRHDKLWKLGTKDQVEKRWPGVTFDKIDTAAYWGSNKIYFFSEDQYIRYDFGSHRADPGYPRSLSSNYIEDWALFD